MSLTGKPALTSSGSIENDGFWPELSIGDLLTKYRIPSEYDDGVIRGGTIMAIIQVNHKLEAVKAEIKALAYPDFTAYFEARHPDKTVDGVNLLQLTYEHAVFTRAKANLLRNFNSLNRKPNAENAAKESDETAEFWLNESQTSIKALVRIILPLDESVPGTDNVHVALL